MKILLQLGLVLLLLAPGVCLGSSHQSSPGAPDTESLVAAITVVDATHGSITISDDETPFAVTDGTTIVIDGRPATLADVKKGMRVMSRTLSDSSAPEIDLKTDNVKKSS